MVFNKESFKQFVTLPFNCGRLSLPVVRYFPEIGKVVVNIPYVNSSMDSHVHLIIARIGKYSEW